MQRIFVYSISLLAALWIGAQTEAAEHGSKHGAPDITGTWKLVAGEVIAWNREARDHSEISGQLVIDKQTGGVFHGVMTWDNSEASAAAEFHDVEKVHSLVENEVLGVIDWDDKRIVIVDRDKDESVYEGKLINGHTLQMIGFEPGEHAFATRFIYIRD